MNIRLMGSDAVGVPKGRTIHLKGVYVSTVIQLGMGRVDLRGRPQTSSEPWRTVF